MVDAGVHYRWWTLSGFRDVEEAPNSPAVGRRREDPDCCPEPGSGCSVSQVACRYDVNANLVFKWPRDPRFNPPPAEGLNGSFLPVEVVASPLVADPPVITTPVIESKALGSRVEITLPSGHRINLSGAYDPDALCRLVRGWVDDPDSGIRGPADALGRTGRTGRHDPERPGGRRYRARAAA